MSLRKVLLVLLSLAVLSAFSIEVYSADVGNNTSQGEVNVPGRASPGNAAWADKQTSTMWKLTIYVAKDNTVSFDDSEISKSDGTNPLKNVLLSDKFYKFGETFWLYEGTNESGAVLSIYEKKKAEYSKRIWFAVSSKEDYLKDFRSLSYPGGNLSFNMSSSDSIEQKLFDVRDYPMLEGVCDYGYPPKDGNRIILPYVKNVNANSAYNDPVMFDDAVSFFFTYSKKNWNMFLDFAAKASGYDGYSQLLYEMLENRKFTYDGTVITSFDDVNPARKQSTVIPGRWEDETSQVAWVLMFEPAIVFYKYLDNGYNYFVMTESDAAAAMISGCIAFTVTSGLTPYTLVSGVKNQLNAAPESIRNELVSWSFISPFFINLTSSVVPEYPWFGYRKLISDDYYSISSNLLYYDCALLNGGVGFRYQAGGKTEPVTKNETKIVLDLLISNGSSMPDFTGVTFSLGTFSSGVNLNFTADYSVINGLSLNTQTNHSSLFTEKLSSGSFEINATYEKLLLNGDVLGRCTLLIPDSIADKSFTIKETSVAAGCDCVRFTTPNGKVNYSKSCNLKCSSGNTYNVLCENMKTVSLEISKTVYDQYGNTVFDYSDIVFVLSGADNKTRLFGTVAVDAEGNFLSPMYQLVDGRIVLTVPFLYDSDGDNVSIIETASGLTSSVTNVSGSVRLSIGGLPDGSWKIKEYYKSEAAAEAFYRTNLKYGEMMLPGYLYPTESDNITVSKIPSVNQYGSATVKRIYFENYKTSDSFDLTLESIMPNADYTAGTDVITSYYVKNLSEEVLLSDRHIRISFRAFCLINGEEVKLNEQVKSDIVVPANGSNLCWFKWHVPDDIGGSNVYCEAEVNFDMSFPETDYRNNGALVINEVGFKDESRTPDTYYEREKPSSFDYTDYIGDASSEVAEWYVYEQVENNLIRVRYALTQSYLSVIRLLPDEDLPGENNQTIKSGSGFYIEAYQVFLTSSGSIGNTPMTESYTPVQSMKMLLPEFNYSSSKGKYEILEQTAVNQTSNGSCFMLFENDYSDSGKRIHFIPLWFKDGQYKVVLISSDIWTPAGMIEFFNISTITVSGDAYDGWYTRK